MALWTLIGLAKGKATTGWPKRGSDWPGRPAGHAALRPRAVHRRLQRLRRGLPDRGDQAASDGGGLEVDYGRCVVCQLCTEACPTGAMAASTDWAFGVRRREDLHWAAAAAPATASRATERNGFRRSLHIRHVDAGSCNGCESELQALNNPFYNLHRMGIFFTPSPRFADLLLVTGPVTRAMEAPLRATYEAMPQPRWVMATGTCAVSGGIAEGGYACGHGLDGVIPVDVYLPGCPPNPAAIIEALLMFLDRAPQRVQGGRIAE